MTTKQIKLVAAMATRLSSDLTHGDLLRASAREVGLSQTEALIELDAIVAEAEVVGDGR